MKARHPRMGLVGTTQVGQAESKKGTGAGVVQPPSFVYPHRQSLTYLPPRGVLYGLPEFNQ
jgi:hypothetical protein